MRGNFALRHAIPPIIQPVRFGIAVCIGSQHDGRSRSVCACDGKLRACQWFFRQAVRLGDADSAPNPFIRERRARRFACRDGHALTIRHSDEISRRRVDFAHGIISCRKVSKVRRTVRACGLCRHNCAGSVRQLERRARQHRAACRIRLSHDQCAVRHIKADFRGLERIRRSPLRNDDLLHIRIRHGDQKIGFQLLRRNGFRGKRKTASCLGNGNGVAAVQINVCAVLAARIAGNRSDRAADTDARRVRGQRRRTGAYAVGDGYGHIRHRDFAGHLRIGQGVCRQPTCIFEIFLRRLSRRAVELVHVPVIADVLRPFQLLDDFSNRKLSSRSRPFQTFILITVKSHVGERVPQHPADGVHRLFAVYDAGVACCLPVLRQIDDLIRSFRVVFDAGAVHRVFKAIDHMLVDVMPCRVNRAIVFERRNLHVVMHGIGIYRLSRVKLTRVAAERLQSRRVIRRVQLHRRKREGVSRHVIICRIGRLGFLRHHPDCRRVRPRHLSIGFFLAVQIAHQQPCSPHAVLPDFFHPDVCGADKTAVVQLAVYLIRRFIHIRKHARIFRDENEHARLMCCFRFGRWQGGFGNLRSRLCRALRRFDFRRQFRRIAWKLRLGCCFR